MFGVYFCSKMSKMFSHQGNIVVIQSEFDSAVLLYNFCLDATNYTGGETRAPEFW